jgi:hypothetical protein
MSVLGVLNVLTGKHCHMTLDSDVSSLQKRYFFVLHPLWRPRNPHGRFLPQNMFLYVNNNHKKRLHTSYSFGPCGLFQFRLTFFSQRYESMALCRTPLTSNQPVARPLPTQNNTETHIQRQTSVPPAEFEPTIPATKTYALDRAATDTGNNNIGYLFIEPIYLSVWSGIAQSIVCKCLDNQSSILATTRYFSLHRYAFTRSAAYWVSNQVEAGAKWAEAWS